MSAETKARKQLRTLLGEYEGSVASLRLALEEGEVDGRIYWSRSSCCGCVLGTVLAATGVVDPAWSAHALGNYRALEEWAEGIVLGDEPDEGMPTASGPYRAAMLVQWVNEWEAERVSV